VRAEVESLLAHFEQAEKQGLLPTSSFSPAAVWSRKESDELREQSIGPYAIKHLISQGGFGSIYLAVRTDGQYQGRVAIKVLKRGLDTDDILRRFANERQTLAALRKDPNIVTLLDGGSTADGRPYFVMEYVEGKPLDKYCDQHHLSIEDRLRIFRTVCSAVHYAHKNLIVHRDLKPSNILVTGKDDRAHHGVKLLDFGIAKFLNPELAAGTIVATDLWQRLLTPQYASPEQVRGDRIDVTSDVYSLGVILYELLTGHLPYRFDGNRANIEKIVCEQEAEAPSTKVAATEELATADGTVVKISPEEVALRRKASPARLRRKLAGDLDNIVLKALQKDPERRYRSVYELSQDVHNYLEGNPVTARGNPFGYRTAKFLWKHKGKFTVAALMFLALTFLTGWAVIASEDAKYAAGVAFDQTKKANKAQLEAEEAESTARRYWYLYDLSHVYHAWNKSHIARALVLLDRQRPPQGKEDLRGFEWYYYWGLCQNRPLAEHPRSVLSVAASPDGKTLASASGDGTIKLWRRKGNDWREQEPLPIRKGLIFCLAFSADGKTLALGRRGAVVLLDLTTMTERVLEERHDAGVRSVAFSRDGQNLLASGSADAKVRLWKLGAEKEELLVSFEAPGSVSSVAFSPDGRTLACASAQDKTIKLWDIAKKEGTTLQDDDGKGGVWSLAFSPDGLTLASGSSDKTVILWDLATRQKRTTLAGPASVLSVAFSPDGKYLAAGSEDTSVLVWDIASQTKKEFKGHTAAVKAVTFALGGQIVVSAGDDKTVRLWDAAKGTEPRSLLGEKSNSLMAFSPDGKLLARGNDTGTVTLWEAATGRARVPWAGHIGAVNAVAFAPNGKTLATASADKTVKLWDVDTGKEVTLRGHTQVVNSLAFAPDGKTLASGSMDQTVKLWDVNAGPNQEPKILQWDQQGRQHGLGVKAVAFSPDGKTLAVGNIDWSVKLWKRVGVGWEESNALRGHIRPVTCVVFAPDGKTLASSSADQIVYLWDTSDFTKPPTPLTHASAVRSVAFARDSKTVATASQEVKLWDVAIGEERATFKADGALSVAFAPDGETLASGSMDGTLTFWEAPRAGKAGLSE